MLKSNPNFVDRCYWPCVGLLLGAMMALQVLSVRGETQTNDEAAHLVAGYSYWTAHDFRLNPEHPPLSKLLCAAPLLALRLQFPHLPGAWRNADEFALGRAFLYHNMAPAGTILLAGRSVTILLTAVLGLLLSVWTRKRFGAAAALFSTFLFAADPNFLAHGRYVTSDVPVTLFFLAACLSWFGYLETSLPKDLLRTGMLLGLALGTKFSSLLLYPIFLLAAMAAGWRPPAKPAGRPPIRLVACALMVVPWLAVFALYMFDTRSVAADPLLSARLERAPIASSRLVRAAEHIPIPAYYWFRGMQLLYRHAHGGHTSYLMGRVLRQGSWLYFPIAFLLKTPLATLALLALTMLAVAMEISGAPRAASRRNPSLPLFWLGIPPAVYFIASLGSPIDIGLRHILPIYPFLYMLIGAALFPQGEAGRPGRPMRTAALALAALLAVESAGIYPHYLAFFNAAAGGPAHGARYLIDSNLDWGQDLFHLKEWASAHGAPPLCLSYFGEADPAYYGISYRPLGPVRDEQEEQRLDCVAAISAQHLFAATDGRFRRLQRIEPVARIGYSIFIFDLRRQRAATR
jgi:hypothetical protein